jgi:hypothetical protein
MLTDFIQTARQPRQRVKDNDTMTHQRRRTSRSERRLSARRDMAEHGINVVMRGMHRDIISPPRLFSFSSFCSSPA